MNRELVHVLISLVLMAAIWAVTLFLVRPGSIDAIGILLLIGSLWATVDFLRALWRFMRTKRSPDDEE